MKIDPRPASRITWRNAFARYAFAAVLVAIAVALRTVLENKFGPLPLFLTFYPAVLLAATICGGWPGILATVLSALAVDFWFLTPHGLFNFPAPNDVLSMGIFAGCNILLCILAERLRRMRWIEAQNDARQLQLEEISQLNDHLSKQTEELSQQAEELSQQSEELAQQNEELSQQSEEVAQQNEELQSQSEEIQSLYVELTHREDMLQKLLDAARLGTDEKAVMRQICATAKDMFGDDACAIVVYETQGDRLTIRAHAGVGRKDAEFPSRPLENTFAAFVIAENKTACLSDASLRPDLAIFRIPGEEPFQSVLVAPMRFEGKAFGAVGIYSRRKQAWTTVQFRLAEWLATQCGHILETLRLQDQVCRLYAEQQMIFDAVPAMIWYKDAKNNFIRVNQAAAHSVGMPREAIEGYSACELFPHQAEQYYRDDLEVINSGCPKLGILELLETSGGEKRWVQTEKIPFRGEGEEITGVIVFCVDVTDQIRSHEQIELLRQELMHTSRLTAMGELASGIAHEINQPLTVVTTWAEVVKREIGEKFAGDNQESLLALTRISDAIVRAGNIVNRMKNFARKSETQKTILSMKAIVDEVSPLIEHQLRMGGVELSIDVDESLPPVLADRAQIQQVLLNLIRNAHDAMEN